jgi:hypothetical protein
VSGIPALEQQFSEQAAQWRRLEAGKFTPFFLMFEVDGHGLLVPSSGFSIFDSLAEARTARFDDSSLTHVPLFPAYVLTQEESELRYYDVRGAEPELAFVCDLKGRPPLPSIEAPGPLSRPSSLAEHRLTLD